MKNILTAYAKNVIGYEVDNWSSIATTYQKSGNMTEEYGEWLEEIPYYQRPLEPKQLLRKYIVRAPMNIFEYAGVVSI